MALLTRPDRSTGAFPNADAFLKHGLGYCVLYDGQPVGFALSYATYNSGIEIDLWIHEAHRRQGLATTVSAHLITTSPKNWALRIQHEYTETGSYGASGFGARVWGVGDWVDEARRG